MPAQTDLQLLALIAQYFPDNTTEEITPAVLRGFLTDLVNSKANVAAAGTGSGLVSLRGITEFRDRFDANFDGTAEEALEKLLVKYQDPAFASFQRQGQGSLTVEVGTDFPAGFKSFTWAINNGGNVRANSITVRDVTANSILAAAKANTGSLSASTSAFTAQLGLSRVYLISAVNSNGSTFSVELTISGLYKSYFGYSPTNGALSVAQLLGMGNDQLQSGRARTVGGVTAGAGLYTVYAWPSAGNDDVNKILLDGADSIRGAFGGVRYATGPNALGAQVTLGYLVSNAQKAFTNASLAFN